MLGKVDQFKADQEAVQKAQMDMLTTLRNIRAAIVSEDNGGNSNDSKELAMLREENEKLKVVNQKQAYRINHLVANMEKMLGK